MYSPCRSLDDSSFQIFFIFPICSFPNNRFLPGKSFPLVKPASPFTHRRLPRKPRSLNWSRTSRPSSRVFRNNTRNVSWSSCSLGKTSVRLGVFGSLRWRIKNSRLRKSETEWNVNETKVVKRFLRKQNKRNNKNMETSWETCLETYGKSAGI